MDVRNLSAGGIYLVGTPEEYPDLSPGTNFELVIFGAEDGMGDDPILMSPAMPPSSASTKAVRASDHRGSRTVAPIDEENRNRLSNLLLRGRQLSGRRSAA